MTRTNLAWITVVGLVLLLTGLVSIVSATEPATNSTAMIVWSTTHDDAYLFWCDLNASIKDKGDTWDVKSAQGKWMGVSQDQVAYDYYNYLDLTHVTIGTPLAQLALVPMTSERLPQSGHYARLDAVHPGDTLKAEVARYYDGQWYTNIRCLVTLTVMQAYQAQDLALGDFVWVYYSTDPRPGHHGESIPIVVDKVVYP